MSTDQNLLESVRAHRTRLAAAMLFGAEGRERPRRSMLARLLIGVVIAALAAAACVGVGYVQHVLEQQRIERQQVSNSEPAPTAVPSLESGSTT